MHKMAKKSHITKKGPKKQISKQDEIVEEDVYVEQEVEDENSELSQVPGTPGYSKATQDVTAENIKNGYNMQPKVDHPEDPNHPSNKYGHNGKQTAAQKAAPRPETVIKDHKQPDQGAQAEPAETKEDSDLENKLDAPAVPEIKPAETPAPEPIKPDYSDLSKPLPKEATLGDYLVRINSLADKKIANLQKTFDSKLEEIKKQYDSKLETKLDSSSLNDSVLDDYRQIIADQISGVSEAFNKKLEEIKKEYEEKDNKTQKQMNTNFQELLKENYLNKHYILLAANKLNGLMIKAIELNKKFKKEDYTVLNDAEVTLFYSTIATDVKQEKARLEKEKTKIFSEKDELNKYFKDIQDQEKEQNVKKTEFDIIARGITEEYATLEGSLSDYDAKIKGFTDQANELEDKFVKMSEEIKTQGRDTAQDPQEIKDKKNDLMDMINDYKTKKAGLEEKFNELNAGLSAAPLEETAREITQEEAETKQKWKTYFERLTQNEAKLETYAKQQSEIDDILSKQKGLDEMVGKGLQLSLVNQDEVYHTFLKPGQKLNEFRLRITSRDNSALDAVKFVFSKNNIEYELPMEGLLSTVNKTEPVPETVFYTKEFKFANTLSGNEFVFPVDFDNIKVAVHYVKPANGDKPSAEPKQ